MIWNTKILWLLCSIWHFSLPKSEWLQQHPGSGIWRAGEVAGPTTRLPWGWCREPSRTPTSACHQGTAGTEASHSRVFSAQSCHWPGATVGVTQCSCREGLPQHLRDDGPPLTSAVQLRPLCSLVAVLPESLGLPYRTGRSFEEFGCRLPGISHRTVKLCLSLTLLTLCIHMTINVLIFWALLVCMQSIQSQTATRGETFAVLETLA